MDSKSPDTFSSETTNPTQIVKYDPLAHPEITPELCVRIGDFARTIIQVQDPLAYTRRLLARLTLHDPNLVVFVAVRNLKPVAHFAAEILDWDGQPTCAVLQISNQSDDMRMVDKMVQYIDNWCRAMKVTKQRTDFVGPVKVAERWTARYGYRIRHITLEREID